MERFWMVMKDNPSHHSSMVRHTSKEDAWKEAERLCKKEGCRFFVMTFVAYVELESPPVKWSDKTN